MNDGKFIYVFDTDSRDAMLKAGFILLATDERNSVFVFSRESSDAAFSFSEIDHMLSNTLSF